MRDHLSEIFTAQELRNVFAYDAETGDIFWLETGSGRSNPAGFVHKGSGYRWVGYQGRKLAAHRLIWLLHYGAWPELEIDHVNRIKHDNKICNLRQATPSENASNKAITRRNRSGFKYVCYRPNRKNPWQAKVCKCREVYIVGYFSTPEEAHVAALTKAKQLYGEFVDIAAARPQPSSLRGAP